MLPECFAEIYSKCDDLSNTKEVISMLRSSNSEIKKKNIMIILSHVIWNQEFTMDSIKRLIVGCTENQKEIIEAGQKISYSTSSARETARKKIDSIYSELNQVEPEKQRIHNSKLEANVSNARLKNDTIYDKVSPEIHRSIEKHLFEMYPAMPYISDEHDSDFKKHITNISEENLQLIDDSLRAMFFKSEIFLPKKAAVTLAEAYWITLLCNTIMKKNEISFSGEKGKELLDMIIAENEKEQYKKLLLSYIIDSIHRYLENRNFNADDEAKALIEVDKYHFLILPCVELMLRDKPQDVKITFNKKYDNHQLIWNSINLFFTTHNVNLIDLQMELYEYYSKDSSWGIINRKDTKSKEETNFVRRYWSNRTKEIKKEKNKLLGRKTFSLYEASEIYIFASYIEELIKTIQSIVIDYHSGINNLT